MQKLFTTAFVKLSLLLLAITALFYNELKAQDYEPLVTRKEIVRDTFFSKYVIEDDFRWLENTESEESKVWKDLQNKAARKYLFKATNKQNASYAMDRFAYSKYDFPIKKGKYYFKKGMLAANGTSVLAVQNDYKDPASILVDPNSISIKDQITLKDYSVSHDSKLLAYTFSRNGSDNEELKVISISSGFHKKDHLTNLKNEGEVQWKGDGFFYSKYTESNKFGPTGSQQVYFHKVEQDQSSDSLIFERNNPDSRFNYITTYDERYFVITDYKPNTKNKNVYYIDYKAEKPAFLPLVINQECEVSILNNYGEKFIAVTDFNAKNGSIVEIDPANPYVWKSIAPAFDDAVLVKTFVQSDRIIALYKSDSHQFLTIYNYQGEILTNIKLPVGASVGGISAGFNDDELLYNYTSYTVPPVVFKLNTRTFEQKLLEETIITFDYKGIEYKAVEYPGKDSVLIPMILVYLKGMKQDGSNPALLKAYGGYGVTENPHFDPGIVYFIKQGGVFAFANIRGGGEKGNDWAEMGRGDNKQTCFDDFIAAAEYLIKEGYTNSAKLASTGSSHGGLVVAAAAVQRPDLFRAVVPVVGPMDMLRFEHFTGGRLHAREYGTTKDSLSFLKLKAFSPYHNIQESVNYPSMLIMTSEYDDRVPPLHSYKFAARLQNRSAQTNPVLLRIEKKSGHYGAATINTYIAEAADMYGFILNELKRDQ